MKVTVLKHSGQSTNGLLFIIHSFDKGLLKIYDTPKVNEGAEETESTLRR